MNKVCLFVNLKQKKNKKITTSIDMCPHFYCGNCVATLREIAANPACDVSSLYQHLIVFVVVSSMRFFFFGGGGGALPLISSFPGHCSFKPFDSDCHRCNSYTR